TGITAIDGALTTINYSSGLALTIQTVNSRTTTLAYSGTNLTSITDPGGGQQTFSYEGSHHLTGDTFANTQTVWAYTSAGTVGTFTWGSSTGPGGASNPSTTKYSPALTQGLNSLLAGTVWGSQTDPDGNTTAAQLDSQGLVLQNLNADGGLATYSYSNGFVNG